MLVLRQYQLAMDAGERGLAHGPQPRQRLLPQKAGYKETGDTTRAISSIRTAVGTGPFLSTMPSFSWGLLHAAIDDDLALQYYNTALELRPRSVEPSNKGMFAQEHGQDSLALACYDRIREIDPRNATAWYNAGWVRLST